MKVCTGCAGCAAVCPVDAIAMRPDAEGFIHPQINPDICNDCHLCRQICPVNRKSAPVDASGNVNKRINPLRVFAAWNLDDHIRRESSSGGVFNVLANHILARDGAVVGAAFDDKLVVRHEIIEKSADLHRLRGSKYVQSEIAPSLYRQVQNLLKQNHYVLFSGTPCQVASLRGFLREQYDHLFCCDLICHGVPSPLLFARYLQFNREQGNEIIKMCFRDKATGWKNFGIRHYLKSGGQKLLAMFDDPYMAAFHHDVVLRLSCYACNFKSVLRSSDLTIADFWGVAKKYPEYDRDDKGTSLVLVNTTKGQALLDACRSSLFLGLADLETAMAGNSMLIRSANCSTQRNAFYHDLNKMPFADIIRKYRLHPPSLLRRIVLGIKVRLVSTIKRILRIVRILRTITL